MIFQSVKLSKCSKQELLLIIQAEVENRQKLINLIDKEYDNWNKNIEDARFPNYQSSERKAFLDGIEAATNIVKNFWGNRNE